jgi:hypothetical protein
MSQGIRDTERSATTARRISCLRQTRCPSSTPPLHRLLPPSAYSDVNWAVGWASTAQQPAVHLKHTNHIRDLGKHGRSMTNTQGKTARAKKVPGMHVAAWQGNHCVLAQKAPLYGNTTPQARSSAEQGCTWSKWQPRAVASALFFRCWQHCCPLQNSNLHLAATLHDQCSTAGTQVPTYRARLISAAQRSKIHRLAETLHVLQMEQQDPELEHFCCCVFAHTGSTVCTAPPTHTLFKMNRHHSCMFAAPLTWL